MHATPLQLCTLDHRCMQPYCSLVHRSTDVCNPMAALCARAQVRAAALEVRSTPAQYSRDSTRPASMAEPQIEGWEVPEATAQNTRFKG